MSFQPTELGNYFVPFNIEEVDPSCVSVIVKDASGKSVAHPTLMELQLECGR